MLALYTCSIFLSAALLFWVQPMVAKMVLPMLGGTPSVWNTCLLFYQAVLLLGYVYAHLTPRLLGLKRHAVVHIGLLLLAMVALPVRLPEGWVPPVGSNPAPWVFAILAVAVGGPFFVLSATAPLLQRWFYHTDHPEAKDPYFLYSSSNLGSLGALLAYPLLLEPNMTLSGQSLSWGLGYVTLVVLISACGWAAWRNGRKIDYQSPSLDEPAPSVGLRLRWVLLSFAPATLLYGVTRYITTDLASVPLLWVIPLCLYLFTFVLAFARRQPLGHRLMVRAQPFALLPLALVFLGGWRMWPGYAIALHLLLFFLTAMVCHGELNRLRPGGGRLTEFYLLLSLGGVLGGAFNALLAPAIFNSVLEYPLAIMLAFMLRPYAPGKAPGEKNYRLDVGLPILLAIAVAMLDLGALSGAYSIGMWARGAVYAVLTVFCLLSLGRPVRLGLGISVVLLAGVLLGGGKGYVLHTERSFFSVLKVASDTEGRFHMLYHGTTLHGAQRTDKADPATRDEPLTYFHREGPVGQVLSALKTPESGQRDVAVVGLGAGTLGSYAKPGEHWTFYEIDPAVERIARDTRFFTYLANSKGMVDVVTGDARLTLAREPAGRFGMIVLDAFSSDTIPVHLITTQALKLYINKLAQHGVIIVNITNRNFDFRPVLRAVSQSAGLAGIYRSHRVGPEAEGQMKFGSTWAVLARSQDDLGPLAHDPAWLPLSTVPAARAWTDDYSNILGILR